MAGKNGFMTLKLVLSKTYDRIERNFLGAILKKMRFRERWIQLMLKCVDTVQYDKFHEGRRMGPIYSTSIVRQGDPLLAYLFLLCAEDFSALINNYERNI